MEPLIIKSDIGASVKTTRNQLLSYDYIGASVKTIHKQSLSYNYITHHNCIYPYHGIKTTKKGECLSINIPRPIYNEIVKRTFISINSTNIEINLLKYLINKLYH